MKLTHKLLLSCLLGLLALTVASPVLANDPTCVTFWDPNSGQFVTVCSGGGGGGGGGGATLPPPAACVPGTLIHQVIIIPIGGGLCEVWIREIDACTGQVVFEQFVSYSDICGPPTAGSNPCVTFIINPAGIFCETAWGIQWLLSASVGFPVNYLDLRPYPATLVRWPTAARNGGQDAASGSGSLRYIAYGGGTPTNPQEGDWQDVTLTLQLTPASPMFFTMPHLGTLALPNVGPTGAPNLFTWELPSHPDVGGGPLAGTIGLNSLPADLPVFAGYAQSAYRLFWTLTYEEYVEERECEPGPNANGVYQCQLSGQSVGNDGHWEYYYEWQPRSDGAEIPPTLVQGLPAALAADLNGDGTPDAYWNNNILIRRMDDSNHVDASWNGISWGGLVYWAVREGQAQIGWPGVNP